MSAGRSYRDLIVWQRSMDLAKRVYEFTRCFPQTETYGLTSQIRRAVVSIPANIAEGQERRTAAEFGRFLRIAKGSLAEVETMLLLAREFQYGALEVAEGLLDACNEIGRLLNGLRNSLPSDR